MKGLKPALMQDVMLTESDTLQAAITQAKLVERVRVKTDENNIVNQI